MKNQKILVLFVITSVPQWVILSLCLVCLLGAAFFDFVPDKHESEKLFITFNKHQRETVFINCSLEKNNSQGSVTTKLACFVYVYYVSVWQKGRKREAMSEFQYLPDRIAYCLNNVDLLLFIFFTCG